MLKIFKDQINKNLIQWLSGLFFFMALLYHFSVKTVQHFTLLAESFLKFKTYFLTMPGSWVDTTLVNGQHYWPLGPLPAVLLIPFIFLADKLGFFFYQGYLSYFIGIAVFYLVYLLSKLLKYKKRDRLFWAFAFCFVSSFMPIYFLPFSWFFSHTIATCLILLFLHLFLNTKNNEWLLGTIIALLIATRPFTALACVLFIVFSTLTSKKDLNKSIQYLIKVFVASPFLLILSLLLLYNQFSFHHLLAGGYKEQILYYPELIKARSYGLFNTKHIAGNLYYSLLSLPQPVFKDGLSHVLKFPFLEGNPWGTSLFFTSPYLIYLFFIRYNSSIKKILLSVSLLTYIPILMYYGIGFRQYGYRYALDFFPFLFLLLMIGYKEKYGEMNNAIKTLIILFAFINLWFFATIFLR